MLNIQRIQGEYYKNRKHVNTCVDIVHLLAIANGNSFGTWSFILKKWIFVNVHDVYFHASKFQKLSK